jgi:YVTN family beta-propeller protein
MNDREMSVMRNILIILISCVVLSLSGCAESQDVFGDIGDSIATPSAMWVDVDTNRLYLVNSNSRVLYDWHQGNFQVLDITDPLVPSLIKSVETDSFSGEIYLDTANNIAYVPNRYTSTDEAQTDRMYSFSTDEAAFDNLLSFTETSLGRDSYAISCCYPADRMWVTTSLNEIQYVDIGSDLAPGSMGLLTTMDDDAMMTVAEVYHIALAANQGFLSRDGGGVLIMNLDEAGVSGVNPVDYFIQDVGQPRGIAVRNSNLYVVGEGNENGNWTRYLLVIDVSGLTPLTDNEFTMSMDKDNDGLLIAMVDVGRSPQELLLTDDYAFVTNMDDDTVSVIDLATNAVVATIAVGEEPFSLALYEDLAGVDQYVYVGNVQDNTISVIDIASLAVVATYP